MIIKKELPNHIRVILEPMEHYVSVSLGVWIQAGSANETKVNNGIAHVTEHMLFKGTKTRSAKDIADESAAIGDNLDAYTSKEATGYYIKTLPEYAAAALELLSDMIQNSELDDIQMERELDVILDEIDMYEDDADEMVHEVLQQEIWKDHPLGYIISGEKDVVRNFTPRDVRSFMNQYYNGRNLVISAAGRFDPQELLKQVEDLFGNLPAGEPVQTAAAPAYRQCLVCRQKEIEQIHLDLAFDAIPYEHKDKYVMSVMNSILGGNGNSRLFQEVREERGLAYTIYSYGSTFRDCGLFQIYAAMNPEQTATVLDAVLTSIDRMKREGVTEQELELARKQLRTELLLMQESTHARMESNVKAELYHEKQVPVLLMAARLEAVTAEDIAAFMETYLQIERVSLCLVGPLADIDRDALQAVFRKWNLPFDCEEAMQKNGQE